MALNLSIPTSDRSVTRTSAQDVRITSLAIELRRVSVEAQVFQRQSSEEVFEDVQRNLELAELHREEGVSVAPNLTTVERTMRTRCPATCSLGRSRARKRSLAEASVRLR